MAKTITRYVSDDCGTYWGKVKAYSNPLEFIKDINIDCDESLEQDYIVELSKKATVVFMRQIFPPADSDYGHDDIYWREFESGGRGAFKAWKIEL